MERITARIFDAEGNPGIVVSGRLEQVLLNVPPGGWYVVATLEELNQLVDGPTLPSEG